MSDNNGNVFQAKIAYLGFIQDVIARMGNHSFLIKGWTITLVTAILSLTKAEKAHFAIAIILLFWWLNAFFLYQEKLYRELYKKVANDDIPSLLFVMDVKE
ncbi:TPA: hypothetical protein QB437_002140, partial [Pasteurella multocida]|nr:hypothetical protein [Pasteurella multocida]